MKVPFLSPLQASASNRIPNPEQARILREIQSSRDTLHQGFLQQLIVGGCALLGIVASLGIPDKTMNIARILALSASISIALGIVAIATALFCQVLRLNRLLMRSRREVCKRTQDTEPKELMTPFEAGAEIAGFAFLFVGLGLIVASRFFYKNSLDMVSEFDFLLLKTRVETLELFTRGMFNGQAQSIQQKWANLHHYLKIYHSELATLCRNLSLSPDRDRADRL